MKNLFLKNNLVKFLFVVMLFMFATITFSACAQVRVMTVTNEDNTIDELVSVSIDAQVIHNFGYNVEELKVDISSKSQAQAQNMVDKLNQKIFDDLFMVFDQETIETLNSYRNGISVIKSEWKSNTYAIGIRFKNIDVYRYYYGIKENVQPEIHTEKHFFYDKMYYYASTMYVKHHDLFDLVNNYYSTQYPELIETESNELLYTYKTELRRQHSDADFITKQDGEYYHTWVVDKNNLDEPIMLYYNVANPENFILVGLGLTVIVTIVLLVIGVLINKHNQSKNENVQIKKDDEN